MGQCNNSEPMKLIAFDHFLNVNLLILRIKSFFTLIINFIIGELACLIPLA